MFDNDLPGTLDTHVTDRRAARFEISWLNRQPDQPPPRWQDYLPDPNEIINRDQVFLLLQRDIEYRIKAGMPALLAEHYFDHSRLQQDDARLSAEQQVQLICWEYQQRWSNGDRARCGDYQAAFPEHAQALSDLKPFFTCPRCRQSFVLEEAVSALICPTCDNGEVQNTTAPETDASGEAGSALDLRGYKLSERLGGGGMGDVYRAVDPALGRDLAIKIMRADFQGYASAERRFLREARVTGSLQHPGIVPIHNLGRLADGRLHYTMRLVRGHTFADILQEQAGRTEHVPELLIIFEKVCQAVAYAHSKRVIHRDLKPSNVMVGRFGEAQVMDWGLAKLLTAEDELTAAEPAAEREGTRIHTEAEDTPLEQTRMGREMGTLAYMPPEQALGEWDNVDERADVFALGAILCEILSGQPPYRSSDSAQALRKAKRGDCAEALSRLESCGVDAALLALCRDCLAPAREDRPRDAEQVAQRVAAYQAEVQGRLRRAELERAAAEVKAAEERKRRRMTVVLASAVLLAILMGGGGFVLAQRHKQARQEQTVRLVQLALGQATALRAQAQEAPVAEAPLRERAAALWRDTVAAADRAEQALADGEADADTARQATELLTEIRRQAAEADKDRRMLRRLEQAHDLEMELQESDYARKRRVEEFIFGLAAVPAYAAAFRDYGIDVETLSTQKASERIRQSSIRFQLAVALDDWYFLAPEAAGGRLLDISRAADPDPLRDRVREAIARKDRKTLKQLADSKEAIDLPVPTLILLADVLHHQELRVEGVQLLKRARRRHPEDFWVNDVLGLHLQAVDPPKYAEAAQYFAAASALRPNNPLGLCNLGTILAVLGQQDDANTVLREAIRIKRDFLTNYERLVMVLLGKLEFEEARAVLQEPLRRHPQSPMLRSALGRILQAEGKYNEAVALLRQVLARNPEWVPARIDLALNLAATGAIREALETLDAAQQSHPELSLIYEARGQILLNNLDTKGALAAYSKAAELGPGVVTVWNGMAQALSALGRYDEALKMTRKAILLAPENATGHVAQADVLRFMGRTNEAEAEYRIALQLNPLFIAAHNGLGLAQLNRKQFKEAEQAFRKALALRPWEPWFHAYLGMSLRAQKDYSGALAAVREAIRLKPDEGSFHDYVGHIFYDQTLFAEAIQHYQDAVRLWETKNGPDHLNTLTSRSHLANACWFAGRKSDAARLYEQNLKHSEAKFGLDHPDTLASRNTLANAYRAAGRFVDAIPLHEQTLKRREATLGLDHPDTLLSMANLGLAYRDAGKLKEAINRFETALQRGRKRSGGVPTSLSELPGALALTYEQAGQLDQAESIYRDNLGYAHWQFGSDDPRTAGILAQLSANLLKQKKFTDAETLLRQCLSIRDKKLPNEWNTFNTRSTLGEALLGQKKYAEAEPLLIQGYEGMKQRQDKIPPAYRQLRLSDALTRLVRLYEAMDQKEKAAQWRKKLEETRAMAKSKKP